MIKNYFKIATLATYKKLWALTQPLSYKDHLETKFYNELNDNKNFFLVTRFNNLDDNVKIKLFGKTDITSEDITFEWLNRILLPKKSVDAVSRFNEAVNGSKNNHIFSYQENDGISKWQFYSPSTVTEFNDINDAEKAKIVLRILVEGSGAHIISEEIENFSKPIPILRDNITLATHNALRVFERFLWNTTVDDANKPELLKSMQEEVNGRIKSNEQWDAFEGTTVFSTLCGKPGVKMYSKVEKKGRLVDDPEDIVVLSKIKSQSLPNLVSNVPDVPGHTRDGRLLENDGVFLERLEKLLGNKSKERFCDILRSALGDKTFEAIFKLNLKLAGELISDEGFGAKKSVVANSKAISGIIGVAGDAIIVIPAFITYIAGYLTLSTIGSLFQNSLGEKLGNKLHELVSNYTGYDFTGEKITKNWVQREIGNLGEETGKESEFSLHTSTAPDTSINHLVITPVFTSYYKDLKPIDVKEFTEKFINECNNNSYINALIISNSSFSESLKEYAKSFSSTLNQLIEINEGKIESEAFGQITKNMFEDSSKVRTPVFLKANKEIKELLKNLFDESQGIQKTTHNEITA
jgi:hypothetical protein